MSERSFSLFPIGIVHSSLISSEGCPKQGGEGVPETSLEVYAPFAKGIDGITVGSEILVLTWLHKAQRELLRVHPRIDVNQPLRGVFATRSPDWPNPIGLHRVGVVEIKESGHIRIHPLEALGRYTHH